MDQFINSDQPGLRVGTTSSITYELKRKWDSVLKEEGLSYVNITDNSVSVDSEIASLFDYIKLMCYYNSTEGDRKYRKIFFVDEIKHYFKNSNLNKSSIPANSFVRSIIDNQTILYDHPALRTIKDNPKQNDIYQEVLRNSTIDKSMQEVYNKLKLTNFVAVRPITRNIKGSQQLQFDVYTPDTFRVHVDNNNQIDKILYEGVIQTDRGYEEVIYVWTNTKHYYVSLDGVKKALDSNPDMVNPYGVIPFVFMQLNNEEGYYAGANFDLIESVIEYNKYKLLGSDNAIYSGFSVLHGHDLHGLGPETEISPRDLILTYTKQGVGDLTPVLEFVSTDPHFIELNEQANKEYINSAKKNGIPTFVLSEDFNQFSSSKALKVAMYQLLNDKQADALTMKPYENELASLIAIIINYEYTYGFYPYTLDETVINESFSIEYMANDFIDEISSEDLEIDLRLLEQNVLSMTDIMIKYTGSISTTKEAEKLLKVNEKINNKYKKVVKDAIITKEIE